MKALEDFVADFVYERLEEYNVRTTRSLKVTENLLDQIYDDLMENKKEELEEIILDKYRYNDSDTKDTIVEQYLMDFFHGPKFRESVERGMRKFFA